MDYDLVFQVLTVFLLFFGVVQVQGMIDVVEDEGCEEFWSEYGEANSSEKSFVNKSEAEELLSPSKMDEFVERPEKVTVGD